MLQVLLKEAEVREPVGSGEENVSSGNTALRDVIRNSGFNTSRIAGHRSSSAFRALLVSR